MPGGGEGAVGSPRACGRARPSRRRCEVWGAGEGFRGAGVLQSRGPARMPGEARGGRPRAEKPRSGSADQRGCSVAWADKSIRARRVAGLPPSLRRSPLGSGHALPADASLVGAGRGSRAGLRTRAAGRGAGLGAARAACGAGARRRIPASARGPSRSRTRSARSPPAPPPLSLSLAPAAPSVRLCLPLSVSLRSRSLSRLSVSSLGPSLCPQLSCSQHIFSSYDP